MYKFLILLLVIVCVKCQAQFKLSDFQGKWATGIDENVHFIFSNDTVRYLEYEGFVKAKVKDNWLELYEDGILLNRYLILAVTPAIMELKVDSSIILKYYRRVK
jgi:hypothetical protein